MKKAIYILTGVMASGKSTVGEVLALQLGEKSVHLRGDIFRRMIVSGREEMSPQPTKEALSQLHLRYRLAAETAKIYYTAGFSVVLQDNYYGDDLLFILELLKGFPIHLTILCPDLKTVKRREAGRKKKGYRSFTPEALYTDFMRSTPKIGYWLDTSRLSPEEAAEAIIAHYT
jgi:chloramphenicol 3-O-phosphotransferase